VLACPPNVVFFTQFINQAMEQGLREVCRSVRIGKILIQRVSKGFLRTYLHVELTSFLGRGDNPAETVLFQGMSWVFRPSRRTRITKLCAYPAPSGYFTALRAPSGPNAWYVLALSRPQMTAQGQQTATGGSAMKAVEVIMEHGVPEERIIFINLVGVRLPPLVYFGMAHVGRAQISAPEGLKRFAARYPSLRVVCCVSPPIPPRPKVSLAILFRLPDGLMMASMSEPISCRDWAILASAGAPILVSQDSGTR
jgi:hypothetical protein